jgi:molybdopterin synthase catalytic subunit
VTGTVTHLEYSAHPDAADHLSRILAAHDSPGLRIALTHRLGLLAVGEAAIVVAVASSHRAEALAGVTAILEAVKRDLPVWKREILADGSHTWVGIT